MVALQAGRDMTLVAEAKLSATQGFQSEALGTPESASWPPLSEPVLHAAQEETQGFPKCTC